MSLPVGTTRRHFLKTSAATAGVAALPWQLGNAQQPAKYRRYNVASAGGQKALASYAKAVKIMLALPPDHPHNWFRNAFVHLIDCPHGNWWFYVWHRGYIGYFEQTIRKLSGDPSFALPYWDWTMSPEIPAGMFEGVLTPKDAGFLPYTKDIATFTSYMQPAMQRYWAGLNAGQLEQLGKRGYKSFGDMWNDVTGYSKKTGKVDPTNTAFAPTAIARYLTADNPKLSDQVKFNCSPPMVYGGLLPTSFYDPVSQISFASSKTPSHNDPPAGSDVFSTLEGFPHNSTHNYIGGYGPIPAGPWGNMTNNLSPVDPVFFLHHSNMDRLWDIWTRKQQAQKLPILPKDEDWTLWSQEKFLFYINADGVAVGTSYAGDYPSTTRWGYDYEPGFGEKVIKPLPTLKAGPKMAAVTAMVKANTGTMMLSTAAVQTHLAVETPASLIALVTLPRPEASGGGREFDVLVGAPAGVTQVTPDSPYYAGTIAFFGGMMQMEGMSGDATFLVPLPKRPEAFAAVRGANVSVTIRVVPSRRGGASVLKSAVVRAL